MKRLLYLNENGDFVLHDAQNTAGLYLPLVNEGGMISSVTPALGGDCKTDQNHFLLAPASAETLHESRATRNFWVTPAGGQPWSVTGQSTPQQAARYNSSERCTLTGGLLWQSTSRENTALGLLAETLSFVPAGQERVEILQIRLTNTSRSTLTLTPTAAIPRYGRSADNIRDHRHVTSLLHRVQCVRQGIDLTATLTFDERGHQPGNTTYRVWGGDEHGDPPVGFMPLVRDFVGSGSYDWPQALVCPTTAKLSHAGDTAEGGEMIAALWFSPVVLRPGQAARYQVVIAIDSDPTPYLTPQAVDDALRDTRRWWQRQAAQKVTAEDERYTPWMRWVAIQPTLRRICGCSFLPHHDYGRGGRGWRDLWQDSLALLLQQPPDAQLRSDLLNYFAGVRPDGTNATIIGARAGEFKADRNGIPRVWMDHGFWPLLTVDLYLNETGDYAFLEEVQPYFSDTLPWRGEGAPRTAPAAAREGTVLEHLLVQNVTAFFDVGEHGHIRLRGADWNDGLDMARERGESVAFTAAYAMNLDTLAGLLDRRGGELPLPEPLAALLDTDEKAYADPAAMRHALQCYCAAMDASTAVQTCTAQDTAAKLRRMGDHLRRHIRAAEWVGDGTGQHWFNSYYDNSGEQVEGVHGDTVRMMLTGQVFCLMSGTATDEQARQIARAVDWYLFDPSCGGCRLNTDFRQTKLDMGRMFGFAYGHKENGAVFCHMAVMYAYALYSRGLAAEGHKVLDALFSQSVDFARGGILPGIPEYFDARGTGMYPWLTGAASWLMLTVQTQVFGVRGADGDLLLEPKLTAGQFLNGRAELDCVAAGRRLHIRYDNPQALTYGDYQIAAVTCGDKTLAGCGAAVRIARSDLPAPGDEPITLRVLLAPAE